MPAQLIDGRAIAQRIRERIQHELAHWPAGRTRPCLAGVLVGGDESARMYARSQGDAARKVGIEHRVVELRGDSDTDDVRCALEALNRDPAVSGILLYQPLPSHLDAAVLQAAITPAKDVEGLHATNMGLLAMGRPSLIPCTAAAAMECLKSTGISLEGCEAVVVGRSPVVGRPVAMLLLAAHATVTQCHTRTRDLAGVCRRGEILIVAAGKPELIGREHVRPGAVVIDVGTHRVTGGDGKTRTVGDVRFDEVSQVASAITPVPGGVGPVTVAMLLSNVVSG